MTRNRVLSKSSSTEDESDSVQGEVERKPGLGFIHFLTLKILFFDLFVSLGDVGSDFAQASELYKNPELRIFGLITFAINWLPGIVAAIHCVSMKRIEYGVGKTIIWAILLVIFYPLIPSMAYIALLWVQPLEARKEAPNGDRLSKFSSLMRGTSIVEKKAKKEQSYRAKFKEMEYLAMVAHAIAGGIESPLQFILQLWLIFCGKVPCPWKSNGYFTITDSKGNQMALPTTAAISLIFSSISMLKAVIELNVVRVHLDNVHTSKEFGKLISCIVDHIPFLVTSCIFRVLSVALIFTYFNEFHGMIPIAIFWLVNLAIGYRKFQIDTNPLWLISFVALFFPIFSSVHRIKKKSKPVLIKLQYETFWWQTLASCIIYIPTLISAIVLVNFHKSWGYDSRVIFNNFQFNVAMIATIAMGILSFLLSWYPNFFKGLERLTKALQNQSDEVDNAGAKEPKIKLKKIEFKGSKSSDQIEADQAIEFRCKKRKSCMKSWQIKRIFFGLMILAIVQSPFILVNVILAMKAFDKGYIWAKVETNHTIAIQGFILNDGNSLRSVENLCLEALDPKTRRMFQKCDKNRKRIGFINQRELPLTIEVKNEDFAAIIIIDGDCEEFAEQNSDGTFSAPNLRTCFRPSFSTNALTYTLPPTIPLLLVQKVDFDKFLAFPDFKGLSISLNDDTIKETKYQCDASRFDREKCLPTSRKYWSTNGCIRGKQWRLIECHWSDQTCLGYDNQEEFQPFCDGYDIFNKFCFSWSPNEFRCMSEDQSFHRVFQCEVDMNNGIPKCEDIATSVKKCDDKNMWTSFTDVLDISGLHISPSPRYRFCKDDTEIFIAEKIIESKKIELHQNQKCIFGL